MSTISRRNLFLALGPLTLVACTPASDRASIAWMGSYPLALEAAIEEEKPMLVYFSAAWCSICRTLESGALANEEVQSAASGYVAVRIDVDLQSRIAKKFQVEAVPTLLIVSPSQKVLRRSLGAQGVESLRYFLQ